MADDSKNLSRGATRIRTNLMSDARKAISRKAARRLPIVAGPTAAGKSALSLILAEQIGGSVINADAMQCYADWRIITARPKPAEETRAPHRLYGVRTLTEKVDAAWWSQAAKVELHECQNPILCGGTGMYLKSLVDGLAPIPNPGDAARAEARAMLAVHGPAWLHAWLMTHDPGTSAKLKPTDSQRLVRAAEVLIGTGQGLAFWQAQPATPLAGFEPVLILLEPPRDELRVAIKNRFKKMLEDGALDEVRAVASRNLDRGLPGLRAHGVPELFEYLDGKVILEEAVQRAVAATVGYTRRQTTWFRHQKLADQRLTLTICARIGDDIEYSESIRDKIISFINSEY